MQIGFSKLDQPIIYSCMAMAKDHDILANREHMLVTFEQAMPLSAQCFRRSAVERHQRHAVYESTSLVFRLD